MSISSERLRATKNSDGRIRCDLVRDACVIFHTAIDTDACDISLLEDLCCSLEFCFEILTWFTVGEWST